ncbi:histidine--tRNA ligase [Clostridiales bacterium]|nr:histidine--tRNA ligase [Clostridiales bacterium]GFI56308.1 histidine--tRNA ligase [Clostridiales bacterium]
MKTKTVKGTNDYLPADAEIRDYLQSVILDTYKNAGFEHIITPILEDAENLDKSDGGENLNLIFKVLKRGDKLQRALETGDEAQLSDMGLRYDLTLPLCRYFANNRANLMLPFKAIQIDRVYRAERAQRGRLREFIQCDIDIIGSTAPECEIELILTTARALQKTGIGAFKIRLNDRSLLRSALLAVGFPDDALDSVCITFDKLDKIGISGVCEELAEKGYPASTIECFCQFFGKDSVTLEAAAALIGDTTVTERLQYIMQSVNALSQGTVKTEFDISLVRGQGYYTGTVFEIASEEFSGAIGGGGRYDHLIGKFIGEDVPAVGFSIGFERIFSILKDKENYTIPGGRKKVVVLYDANQFVAACKKADELRGEYDVTLCERGKKQGKQLNRFAQRGYDYFVGADLQNLQPLS